MVYKLLRIADGKELLITSSLNESWIVQQAAELVKEYPDWNLTVKDQKGCIVWETG